MQTNFEELAVAACEHAEGLVDLVASGDHDGSSLVAGSVTHSVVGVDGDQQVECLNGGEAGVASHLLECFGVTLGNLGTVLDVGLACNLKRGALGFCLGDELDTQRFTFCRGSLLAFLSNGNTVVGDLQLIANVRVVDDNLANLKAVGGDGLAECLEDGRRDTAAVFVDRVQRHGCGRGLDLVADECGDCLLGVLNLVHGCAGGCGDDLQGCHDRQNDDLVTLGLDFAVHLDQELFQIDYVSHLVDERDDEVQAGGKAAVVATKSLNHTHFLLADDGTGDDHEDHGDDQKNDQQPVGEDSSEEAADGVHRTAADLDRGVAPGVVDEPGTVGAVLGAVVRVLTGVKIDAIVVRHSKTSR